MKEAKLNVEFQGILQRSRSADFLRIQVPLLPFLRLSDPERVPVTDLVPSPVARHYHLQQVRIQVLSRDPVLFRAAHPPRLDL